MEFKNKGDVTKHSWTLWETRKEFKQSGAGSSGAYLNHKLISFETLGEFAAFWKNTPYSALSQLFFFEKAKV
jgi:hypothetical protein